MFRGKFTSHCHYRYNKHLPTVNCNSALSRPHPSLSHVQFVLSMNCNCTWVWKAFRSSFHLPFVKQSLGPTYCTYVRAIYASHYQGHSTTDFQQMSALTPSCALLRVAIHNCKIFSDAAVRSVGFRAINWWKKNKTLSQFTYFLNKGYGCSRYLDNESLLPHRSCRL